MAEGLNDFNLMKINKNIGASGEGQTSVSNSRNSKTFKATNSNPTQ